MQPLNLSFVVLPKGVLLGVSAAFLLLLSPLLLESPVPHLVVLAVALAAATIPKVHGLGIVTIGIPALTALLFTAGDPSQKSWAALFAMLEFYALEQVFWGLAEDAPQPWWVLGVVWLLTPSVLGLLGMVLLFMLCHLRWNASLASVRHTQKYTAARSWGMVLVVLVAVIVLSLWIPLPKPAQLQLGSAPDLFVYQQRQAPDLPPNPDTSAVTQNNPVRTNNTALPELQGSSLVAFLVLVYLYFAWRRLQAKPPSVKNPQKKTSPFLWLLLLTGVVAVLIVQGLLGQQRNLGAAVLPIGSSSSTWLALLFFLALFVAWRLRMQSKNGAGGKLESSENSLEGLQYLAPDDAVRAAYFKWLVWLRDLDLRRSPTQTPSEFLQMVGSQYPAMRTHSQRLTTAYERVRYGQTPSQAELVLALAALEAWQLEVQKRLPAQVKPPEVQSRMPESLSQPKPS